MRKYYWYVSIFLRKHGVIVVGSIFAAIILFSLALPLLTRLFDFKKTTYIGIIGRYSLNSLPLSVQNEISSGLTEIDTDYSVVPNLAERWNTENDGKDYRFLIRKNIFWQDGKPFVPSDVNYNFTDTQVFPTNNDIVFKLKDAFVPFPSIVSQPLFRITEEPYFFFFKRKKLIGIGKNEVSDFKEQGSHLDEITVNLPNEKKVYRFFQTEDDAVTAFKLGEIDVLPDLSNTDALQNWPNAQIIPHLDTGTYLAVFFNTHDDTFKSNEIRQALNYALPKPMDETRAVGPINPRSWAFADVGKHYDYDEQHAIDRLLSPLVIPHQPLQIELTTTSLFNNEAERIKQAWELFGQHANQACQQSSNVKDKSLCPNTLIQVTIKINNFPDTSNYQALLVGEESPPDPDQYSLWHSSAQTNFTHYKNIKIDGLLEKGRQTEDRKKRFEIYSQFQEFFSEDAPVIFIQYLNKYEVRRTGK